MENLNMWLHNLNLVLFPPFWQWWVVFWLALPLAAILTAWLFARYRRLPDNNMAWNSCGRRWRNIGWVLLATLLVVYLLGAYSLTDIWQTVWNVASDAANPVYRMKYGGQEHVINVPFIPHSAGEKTIVFMAFNKEWFCGILPALAWAFFTCFFFLIPGGRIAKEKLGIR